MITNDQLASAFKLQSALGITVENRKFHASAQIGHVHYGYCRYNSASCEVAAQYQAVIECAKSYFEIHPNERPEYFEVNHGHAL